MKDLLDKILKYLPEYLTEFGEAFSGPKTFIGQRNVAGDEAFSNALLFLGLSVALVIVMSSPLRPAGKEFWVYVGSTAILTLVTVALFGTAVRIGWWLVGGRANAQSFFVTYSYFFGVVIVVMAGFQLVGIGAIKLFDPILFGKIVEARAKGQSITGLTESEQTTLIVFLSIFGFGFIFSSIWAFIGWGAYRQLNGLGKGRSLAAMFVTGLLQLPLLMVIFLISSALGL